MSTFTLTRAHARRLSLLIFQRKITLQESTTVFYRYNPATKRPQKASTTSMSQCPSTCTWLVLQNRQLWNDSTTLVFGAHCLEEMHSSLKMQHSTLKGHVAHVSPAFLLVGLELRGKVYSVLAMEAMEICKSHSSDKYSLHIVSSTTRQKRWSHDTYTEIYTRKDHSLYPIHDSLAASNMCRWRSEICQQTVWV